MSNHLPRSVTEGDNGTWDFRCPVTVGCGPVGGPSFSSTGWPNRELAERRGAQHFAEHKGGPVTPSLEEFRTEHGLTVTDSGDVVRAEDL